MKRYIRCEDGLSFSDKLNLRHTMKSILMNIWNADDVLDSKGEYSIRDKTIADYENSDYTSFAEYIMDHKQDIFPRGDVMMQIDEFSRGYKNSFAIRQELLKIFDNYTQKDFEKIFHLPKDRKSSHSVTSSTNLETLDEWCSDLSKKIDTLYLHYTDGTIIGKLSVSDAILAYGDFRVTSSYYEGNGLMSVWILE